MSPGKGSSVYDLECVYGEPQRVNDYGDITQYVYDDGSLIFYVDDDSGVITDIQTFQAN